MYEIVKGMDFKINYAGPHKALVYAVRNLRSGVVGPVTRLPSVQIGYLPEVQCQSDYIYIFSVVSQR